MPAAGAAAWGGGLLGLLAPLPVTLGLAALAVLALLAATVTGGAEDAQSGPSTSQVARH